MARKAIELFDGNVVLLGQFIPADSAWILQMKDVENPELLAIQALFDKHDIAHLSAEHTTLYLIKWNGCSSLLWVCFHYEDSDVMSIVELCGIMRHMMLLPYFEEGVNVSILLLDVNAEKLIISIEGVDGGILY